MALAATVLSVLCAAGRARAEIGVSIQYQSDEQLELARRLSSELSSEGYAVAVQKVRDASPCDPKRPQPVAAPRGTSVWIRFAGGPTGDTIVASICYVATQPQFLETSASAPRSEPRQLALATAEALNGLRSKVPALAVAAEPVAARQETPERDLEPPPRDAPAAGRLTNSVVFGTGLLLNLPDFPASPGVAARVTLGLSPSLGIAIDAFVPIGGSELASSEVSARVRTTWLRLGPRIGGALGRLHVSGAILAGPAVTWATATAQTPRLGTADVAMGAVTSFAVFLEYPQRGVVFACVSASASALLPGVRVKLGDRAAAPRGSWLLDGAIGFGARWGGEP